MKIVTIDEDIVEFLRAIYFGTYTNPYEAASNRAYLDMNRTIRFNGMPSQERDKIRKKVTGILEEEIKMICAIKVSHQEQYDIWHFYVCDKIRKLYRDNHIEFYYGQAQKWVNMTMKYLYIIGECAFDGLFQYLHAPLDKYVFDIAKKEEGIKKPKFPGVDGTTTKDNIFLIRMNCVVGYVEITCLDGNLNIGLKKLGKDNMRNDLKERRAFV